jgi:hypothetical protein
LYIFVTPDEFLPIFVAEVMAVVEGMEYDDMSDSIMTGIALLLLIFIVMFLQLLPNEK